MNGHYILRDNQKPPQTYWRFWSIIAGRGFGKTLAGAHCIYDFIINENKFFIGIMGSTIKDIKNVMLEGPSGLLTLCHNHNLQYQVQWYNNKIIIGKSIIFLFSGERFENLRGFSLDCVWIDEIAKFNKPQETLNQLILCCRKNEPQFIITSTPKPLSIWQFLQNQNYSFFTHGSSYDNHHLPPSYLDIINQWAHTPLGRQEIFGEIIHQNPSPWANYIFKYQDNIDPNSYILSIDPAVTTGGNTTGIILMGYTYCNKIIVVDDFSINTSVQNWINDVINLSEIYKIKALIIETNQGGDLLECTIRNSYKKPLKIIKYFARHNKFSRSLSAAQLYWQNKIVHKKSFIDLERQLINFNDSLDRVDALVWGIEYLMENPVENNFEWSIL